MSNEILNALEKVEAKLNKSAETTREFSDRLMQVEQKSGASFGERLTTTASGLGDLVVKSFNDNRDLFEKTRSVRLEIKAATDPLTTASGRTIVSGGVGAPGFNGMGLQNALKRRLTPGVTAMEYSRFVSQQGAAAVQATEGATKAAVKPDFTMIQQSSVTIAGFTKISRQALNDSQELARAVETTLMRSVDAALDHALFAGVVAPAFAGYGPLADPWTSILYSNLADAVSEGASQMQVLGFSPDTVCMSPASWLSLQVEKATDHSYLSGSYLGPMPQTLRGLRVVLCPHVLPGDALVIDSNHSELMMTNNFTVEIGTSGTDFVQNLATMLGEIRFIPVYRTEGSMRLVTKAGF